MSVVFLEVDKLKGTVFQRKSIGTVVQCRSIYTMSLNKSLGVVSLHKSMGVVTLCKSRRCVVASSAWMHHSLHGEHQERRLQGRPRPQHCRQNKEKVHFLACWSLMADAPAHLQEALQLFPSQAMTFSACFYKHFLVLNILALVAQRLFSLEWESLSLLRPAVNSAVGKTRSLRDSSALALPALIR